MNRVTMLVIVAALSAACFAQTEYIPLDLRSGFNTDLWCGPLEFQGLRATGSQDLIELQGYVPDGVGFGVLDGRGLLLCNSTATGSGAAYSIPSDWNHPLYLSGDIGTPEDGYLLGSGGYPYHIASVVGNSTLAGDWTEVADPTDGWPTLSNGVRIGSYYRIADWQIAEATVELPPAQKGPYASVNFILAAADQADRARNMQIVALYGPDGTDEVVLYAFSTADGGSGPVPDDADGGVDFDIALTTTKMYANDAGPTGAVSSATMNLYEFAAALTLDPAKDLWGFRIEDVDPALTNNARGLAIWAATATRAQAANAAPVADAGADQTVYDMDDDGTAEAQMDGSGSVDSDGQILQYQWSDGGGVLAVGATPILSLPLGANVITLTVTDNSLATDIDTVTITVAGPPAGAPTADAGDDQTVVDADDNGVETVGLDGTGSFDSDGVLVSYQWLIGSTEIATGATPSVDLAIGTHTITLKVVDNDGYYNTDTVVVTVQSSEPIADAGPDQTVVADPVGSKTVALDGSGSWDPAGTIVSYIWDEGGGQIATGETPNVSLAEGVHTITLTVTDDSGHTDTDTVTITVAAYIPPMTYYLDAAAAGPVFDGSATNPWQTVEQMQQALSDKANNGSGDTVIIAPGSYGDLVDGAISGEGWTPLQQLILPRSDWLTLRAQDPGNKPVFNYVQIYGSRDAYLELDGLDVNQPLPHRSAVVYVRNNTRHIRFRNMEIHTVDDHTSLPTGIWITYNTPSDILIEGCDIHTVGVAISGGAANLTVRGNEIHHNCGSGIQTGNLPNAIIEDNYIHLQLFRVVRVKVWGTVNGSFPYGETVTQDVTGATGWVYAQHADDIEIYVTNQVDYGFEIGYTVRGDQSGGTVDPVTGVTVSDMTHASGLSVRTPGYTARGNIIHDYGASGSIFIYPDGLIYSNMLFENNLIYDSIGTAARLQDIGDNFVFRNNTVYGDVHTYIRAGYDGSGLHLYNNVMQNYVLWEPDPLPNIDEGNNIVRNITIRYPVYNGNASFPAGSTSIVYGAGEDALFDALFVDVAARDFQLAASSDAVGFADPANSPADDLLGNPRDPLAPSAGALEYGKPGDADGDGDVDLDDFVILKQTFGQSPLIDDRADFDGDGDVDLDDFVILKQSFGT